MERDVLRLEVTHSTVTMAGYNREPGYGPPSYTNSHRPSTQLVTAFPAGSSGQSAGYARSIRSGRGPNYNRSQSVVSGVARSMYSRRGSGYPQSVLSGTVPPGSFYVGSEYPEDIIDFKSWRSPPRLVRIFHILVLILSAGIFACVASTLPWDVNYAIGGNIGGNYPLYGQSNYGHFGMYHMFAFARGAQGFMMAMAAITILIVGILFLLSLSKSQSMRSQKFYLTIIIVNSFLAILDLIATIVYTVAVNPSTQTAGSSSYHQVVSLCRAYYLPAATSLYIDPFLYHFCIMDPQEAVAVACGFVSMIFLIVASVYAFKTRSKMWKYGKDFIAWDNDYGKNIEKWMSQMDLEAQGMSESPVGSEGSSYGDGATFTSEAQVSYVPRTASRGNIFGTADARPWEGRERASSRGMYDADQAGSESPGDGQSATLEVTGKQAIKRAQQKRKAQRIQRYGTEGSLYETDYTTEPESSPEEENELMRLYPSIASSTTRQSYRQQFESDMSEYRSLHAELRGISQRLEQLNTELDRLPEDSAQYQNVAEEYNKIKDVKRGQQYQEKKRLCRKLKVRLSHIKRAVEAYDLQQQQAL
ncbi:occludin-like isoform X1 [Lethenteron reissneri]|uniref:occludin-like isoform X1 n=2 Tax=Lethenteron reissneri TaxID=7753 RepID=UPI002AB62F06|nr:occludin-like isoform X1 [Lethenteron reissneri]